MLYKITTDYTFKCKDRRTKNNEISKGKCKSIEQKEVDNGYGYVIM